MLFGFGVWGVGFRVWGAGLGSCEASGFEGLGALRVWRFRSLELRLWRRRL